MGNQFKTKKRSVRMKYLIATLVALANASRVQHHEGTFYEDYEVGGHSHANTPTATDDYAHLKPSPPDITDIFEHHHDHGHGHSHDDEDEYSHGSKGVVYSTSSTHSSSSTSNTSSSNHSSHSSTQR